MASYLILDVNYLCWKAHYTTGGLAFDGYDTGVAFGLFRDVLMASSQLAVDQVIFCFDSRTSRRAEIFPNYKISRKLKDETDPAEKVEGRRLCRTLIEQIRTEHLPAIGFRNILWQDGYEADDCIASVCRYMNPKHEIIIMSADGDMLQLLEEGRVLIWNKGTMITEQSFKKKWKISPRKWPLVKAIAGCKTDDVPGVDGVKEKTASKFVAGSLGKHTKAYKAIAAAEADCKERLPLVKLPYEGVKNFLPLQKDEVTRASWRRMLDKLGMRSLIPLVPKELL